MGIVIEDIPNGQVLNTTEGVTSPLNMTVSGLDDTDLDDVTATLDGPYYSGFEEPPVVSSITEGPEGQFAVVVTLTGTLVGSGGGDLKITKGGGGSSPELSSELTVTITQGFLSSDPTPIYAFYVFPGDDVRA